MRCDTKTFAQMYGTVYKDLYRFALCMMRNPQDAEDAVPPLTHLNTHSIFCSARLLFDRTVFGFNFSIVPIS